LLFLHLTFVLSFCSLSGWTSVPTFESFVYHVIEINEDGTRGDVVLQHRAGKFEEEERRGPFTIDLLSMHSVL
jgi:hypothetical protein